MCKNSQEGEDEGSKLLMLRGGNRGCKSKCCNNDELPSEMARGKFMMVKITSNFGKKYKVF